MTRRILFAALALAAFVPTLGSAQERERNRSRDTLLERPLVRVFGYNNRARLGVTVQTQADPETDRYGARIVSVVEDGPAAEAGIKAGDIITKFGSTSLAGARPEDHEENDAASGPGLRLVELAQALDEGDTVRVEYRRNGTAHTATIVAEELGGQFSFRRFDGPAIVEGMPEMAQGLQFFGEPGEMHMFEGPGNFTMTMGHNHDLQMIEMNADLGEYFGTSEGLLVTRRSEDSTIPLRTGDVLLTIDGRKPTSVDHAFRIVHSYEDGETVRAVIMRKRQRVNVEWTVKHPHSEVRGRPLQPSRNRMMRESPPPPARTRM